MNKLRIIAATLLAMILAFSCKAEAYSNAEYHLSGVTVAKDAGQFKIKMLVNPSEYRLKTNQRLEVTPVLRSLASNDSIVLPSYAIAGRNAFYYAERDDFAGSLMRSGKGDAYVYETSVAWCDWMDYSHLDFVAHSTGCCGVASMPDSELPVVNIDFRPKKYTPSFRYKTPTAQATKERRIEGSAYINFPVNRTEIYPDYMVNPQELRKILSSIDTVRLNKDASVKSITLTGFASPEGPYKNNVRLAQGRTEALKEYVRKQYTFPASVFHTNSVPEDWQGLRDSVAVSILEDRDEILDFIDNGNVPIEVRNDKLRAKFPRSYAFLLKNVYPSLRHTNYAIDYELRVYTDVEEIKRVMKERPANLSLNEFFLTANSYPAGSEEYDEVFELAVLYYPDSEVANLNAANSAMNQGNYKRARKLLGNVPQSPDAQYGLAILDALEGNYAAARQGMVNALNSGIKEAQEAIDEIDVILSKSNGITFSEEFVLSQK